MPTISEKNAETLIQEHLREQGWPLTDFSVVTKGLKDGLEGLEADYAILRDGHPAALIEAKRPGKDLWAALEQARGYARTYRETTGEADFDTDGDLDHMVSLWPYTWRHERNGGVRAILKDDKLKKFASERSWWADIDQIRANNYNLTAGRYCPHKAKPVEHEPPQVLINRLLELEDEIKIDLEDLLAMVGGAEAPA